MKFVLLVEGDTEQRVLAPFLKRWLDARLSRPVAVKVYAFVGWSDYFDGLAKRAHLHLTGRNGADTLAVIGLLDLYGPEFYPGHLKAREERLVWAKQVLEHRVSHPKFRQFFAVHELEAWLLSEPAILPPQIRAALPGKCQQPGTVNFDEPPAKLLQRLFREKLGRTYKKVIDGTLLFESLNPEAAYIRCPSLRQLLDEMLSLAKGAGL